MEAVENQEEKIKVYATSHQVRFDLKSFYESKVKLAIVVKGDLKAPFFDSYYTIITETSPSDCLVSYPGHLFGGGC